MSEMLTWGDAIAEAEESGDGKPVPDNEYNVVVDSAKYETSSNGNPMLTCIMKVTDEGVAKNGIIWERLTLSRKAAGLFFRNLGILGITKEDVARLPEPEMGGMEQLAGLIKGRTARVRVKNDSYGPKVQRYIGPATAGGGSAPVPAAAPPVAQPAPTPAPAAPEPQVETSSVSDGDGKIQPPAPPF